jgi:hypothetical protein
MQEANRENSREEECEKCEMGGGWDGKDKEE